MLIGIVIGAIIFIVSWFVGIMSGEHDNPQGMAYVVRLAIIILTCIGSGISIIIWIVRMTNKRSVKTELHDKDGRYDLKKRGKIEYANMSFGQTRYSPHEERQARRKILKISLPVVLSLIVAFIVVLIVGRVIMPVSEERNFLYLLVWYAPISVIAVYANMALWLFYITLLSPSWIADLTCPKCNYLNTIIYVGPVSESTSKYDRKISSTKSHEVRTHTVYDSSGHEVGGVYSWASGVDTFSYGTDITTTHKWICARCGCEFKSRSYVSHEEGKRYELNDR